MNQPIAPDGLSNAAHTAIDALRVFGTTLTREQAADLVPLWSKFPTLTPADVEQVLNHYPTTADLAALASLAHRVRGAR